VARWLWPLGCAPSYHLNMNSTAIQVAIEQANRTWREICQPNWSTSKTKIAGENALMSRIGVAISSKTAP
jgi:hypothetical protein